jgi:hypothetical protein
MALSRCPQKGERIEGLSDDAEPTSNVAEAWGLITSDAMMRRSYRAISWDGIIEYLRNDRQKVRFCYRFNLTKGTDIATTFSIVKPTLQVFSSNLSPLVSGYGGLRTFV